MILPTLHLVITDYIQLISVMHILRACPVTRSHRRLYWEVAVGISNAHYKVLIQNAVPCDRKLYVCTTTRGAEAERVAVRSLPEVQFLFRQ